MGYKIKVDHSMFKRTADVIDNYTGEMGKKMKEGNDTVAAMCSGWIGNDAKMYQRKWNELDDDDSVYMAMKKSLENYSEFLKQTGEKYKKAHADALNRANKLSRW